MKVALRDKLTRPKPNEKSNAMQELASGIPAAVQDQPRSAGLATVLFKAERIGVGMNTSQDGMGALLTMARACSW